MKKILSIFGLLIMISSVAFGSGTTEPSSSVAVTQSGSLVKVFYKSDAKSAKISIVNDTGNLIFSEIVKNKNGFVRPYNFDELEKGTYVITVEDAYGEITKEINITTPIAVLQTAIIKMKDKRAFAVLLSGVNNPSATITVRDQNNKVVLEERVNVYQQMSRTVDLTDIKGKLTLEVSDANGVIKSKSLE